MLATVIITISKVTVYFLNFTALINFKINLNYVNAQM